MSLVADVGSSNWINITTVVLNAMIVFFSNWWIEKKRSDFKASADKELELHKSQLQITVSERNVLFSKLHDRRIQVLELVYRQLVDTEKRFKHFVVIGSHVPDEQRLAEERSDVQQKLEEINQLIQHSQIFLPKETCESLQAFINFMRDSFIEIAVIAEIRSPNERTLVDKRSAYQKASELLRRGLPDALASIEEEFRSLLGAEKVSHPERT